MVIILMTDEKEIDSDTNDYDEWIKESKNYDLNNFKEEYLFFH